MSRPRKPGGRLAWMAFYVDDFLSATTHLGRGALGSYLLLILAYWRTRGPLHDSDVVLAAIARCTRGEWKRDRPILEMFFELRDGKWHHPRIDHELEVAIAASMAAAEKGKAGNETRWSDRTCDPPCDHASEAPGIAQGSLDTQHTPTSSTFAIAPVEETAFPAGLDSEAFRAAWSDWLAYRREGKLGKWKPRTVAAKFVEMAGWGQAAAIESIRLSIANGWQGLFEPKAAGGGGGRNVSQMRPANVSPETIKSRIGTARTWPRSVPEPATAALPEVKP